MENLVLIIVGLGIIYMSYNTYKKEKELKKELKRMRDDFNLEFRGDGGSISTQRKNYPDNELKDDWREAVIDDTQEPHSIAKGMNDPSDMQKKAFSEENKTCMTCKFSEPMHANRWCNYHNQAFAHDYSCEFYEKD